MSIFGLPNDYLITALLKSTGSGSDRVSFYRVTIVMQIGCAMFLVLTRSLPLGTHSSPLLVFHFESASEANSWRRYGLLIRIFR